MKKLDRINYNIVMELLEEEYKEFEKEWTTTTEWQELGYTEDEKWTEAWGEMVNGAYPRKWNEKGGPFYKVDIGGSELAKWYVDDYLPLKQLQERALGTSVMDTSVSLS